MVEGDSNLHPSGWQLSLLHAQLSSFLLVPTSFEELVLLAALRADSGPAAPRPRRSQATLLTYRLQTSTVAFAALV